MDRLSVKQFWFRVDARNIVRINNVPYSFPTPGTNQYLKNDGSEFIVHHPASDSDLFLYPERRLLCSTKTMLPIISGSNANPPLCFNGFTSVRDKCDGSPVFYYQYPGFGVLFGRCNK
jgi:hypothetical protein